MDFPLCANIGETREMWRALWTHILSLEQLLLLLKFVCSFVLLSVPSMCPFLCQGIRLYASLLYVKVYSVCCCSAVCVWASYSMWQKNSPLTLSPLHWFPWSDLITSKCITVSTRHSGAGRQLDDTVCAVILNFRFKIKGCFTYSYNTEIKCFLYLWLPTS